ncbi:MAG TPA: hypothetical protein PLJ71_14920 [Candidatus Hydrogenedentes bacterium]|nr:hypothetical protein [Candidatus Hydrogenedentota bacterium]HQM49979.1 hypothetical protein [Candidatus Hydrogenedentota bacterium]
MKLQLRLWEWAVILVLVFIGAALLMAALPRAREASRHASCASNLKQLGMVMKMFANESKGATFPPLSPIPNNWMFDMSALYPEYLTDLSVLVCPSSLIHLRFERPECVSSLYYIYTGYALVSDEQALALFEAYHYLPFAAFARNDLALPVPVWANSSRPDTAGQSTIPVMWDRIPLNESQFGHVPYGANVLHMDGHVEFVKYSYYNNSDYFPVTRLSAETFGSVLPRMPTHCYE